MIETIITEMQSHIQQLGKIVDIAEVERLRVKVLGKKGIITGAMKVLSTLEPQERKKLGIRLNELKTEFLQKLTATKMLLEETYLEQAILQEKVDVTLPVSSYDPIREGKIHPVSQGMEEIIEIFMSLGFSVAEGNDVETDYHNFTALNFPPSHPAREMHDTFFFEQDSEKHGQYLLRTHTSPTQIHTMLNQSPPYRIIAPGRTYRCDSDQTHTPMFHQVEGLVIDTDITLSHLKWVLEIFCKTYFEVEDLDMRYRPSFFPFTEPSLEVDIQCKKDKKSLQIGTGNDWLEILGCGMVHPQVLKNVGIDPDNYKGFAFGMGIDRLVMLKYGIPDLRAFFEGDLHWLRHFGFSVLDIPCMYRQAKQ